MACGAPGRAQHSRRSPVTQTGVSPDYGSRFGRHLERIGFDLHDLHHARHVRAIFRAEKGGGGRCDPGRLRVVSHLALPPSPLCGEGGSGVGVAPSTQSRPAQAGLPLDHEPRFGRYLERKGFGVICITPVRIGLPLVLSPSEESSLQTGEFGRRVRERVHEEVSDSGDVLVREGSECGTGRRTGEIRKRLVW